MEYIMYEMKVVLSKYIISICWVWKDVRKNKNQENLTTEDQEEIFNYSSG
jgi:hypothetical protein